MVAKKDPQKDLEKDLLEEDDDEEDGEGIADGLERFMDHPNFPKVLEFFREWRRESYESKVGGSKHEAKFKWGILTAQGMLLFAALAVLFIFGVLRILEGQALVGILAAYIGYLFGDRRK